MIVISICSYCVFSILKNTGPKPGAFTDAYLSDYAFISYVIYVIISSLFTNTTSSNAFVIHYNTVYLHVHTYNHTSTIALITRLSGW
jgi:hypothetical protein